MLRVVPMPQMSPQELMPTWLRNWSHERVGRLLAGAGVLFFSALAWLANPAWIIAIILIALNLTQSAVTERCGVKSLLIRLGFKGERDLGRGPRPQLVEAPLRPVSASHHRVTRSIS